MKELYDFSQHTYHVCIYLDETAIYTRLYKISNMTYFKEVPLRNEANIIYNQQKTEILAWGTTDFKISKNYILYDNFRNELYRLFKKGKHNWNEDDTFFIEAVSQFLKLIVEEKVEENRKYGYIESFDFLNYAFIVPSEWKKEIRDDLIQLIFIKAGLILRNDHKNRLLFVSDLQSVCYSMQQQNIENNSFRKFQNTIMCRCKRIDKDAALIKINLINTTNPLYGSFRTLFYVKTILSDFFYITSRTIKQGIKTYLERTMFFDKEDVEQYKYTEMLVNKIYRRIYQMVNRDNDYNLVDPKELELNNSQRMFLNTIRPFDICSVIDTNFHDKIKNMCSNNLVKQYKLFVIGDYPFFSKDETSYLIQWMKVMLDYSVYSLAGRISLDVKELQLTDFNANKMIVGASFFVRLTIENYIANCTPRIIPNESQSASLSIFKRDSKPDAFIIIDISLKSTLLSYTFLNEDGIVVKVFDSNHFKVNECLPPLETFYNITSNKATLKTKELFISFAEKYLRNDSKPFRENKDILFQIEAILNEKNLRKDIRASAQQHTYIKEFLLMYFVYMEKIISSKLPAHRKSEPKTGYAISVEKMLLDNIIGSKEDFKNLLYKSCLIDKDDNSKKLRVITKGEEVLSLIQPLLRLEFPVRSYFVLAQLHESYVQLTLNQVVTAYNLEDKRQEAIIIEDKIVSIQNIYDTLCINMWNNLVENSSLIQPCDIHHQNISPEELFLLTNRIEFTANFKKYISENILDSNSNLRKYDKKSIKMSPTCNCKVNLTIDNIIEISFKPFLKDITFICMGSMINDNIFGKYKNIDYHFTLIYFNRNRQFLDIMIDILKENCKEFNPWQGIDTTCIVIPELTTQFFQPTLNLQPYLYKGFLSGTFQKICTENYALKISTEFNNEVTVYKSSRIGKDDVGVKNDSFFPLIKKGDIITKDGTTKFFYLDSFPYDGLIYFDIYTYKTLNNGGTIATQDETWTYVGRLSREVTEFCKNTYTLPVMVTFSLAEYVS